MKPKRKAKGDKATPNHVTLKPNCGKPTDQGPCWRAEHHFGKCVNQSPTYVDPKRPVLVSADSGVHVASFSTVDQAESYVRTSGGRIHDTTGEKS